MSEFRHEFRHPDPSHLMGCRGLRNHRPWKESSAEWYARRRGIGSAQRRRQRRAWMLRTFGDGKRCRCRWCGTTLDDTTLTVDRFPLAGKDGGTYRRSNIVPACLQCNSGRGDSDARGVADAS